MSSVHQLDYRPLPGWEQLPEGLIHRDVSDVAVDAQDRVYLVTRVDHRVVVYEQDGTFVTEWGSDVLTDGAHGITVGPDGSVYVADRYEHTVRKFTPQGEQLMLLGTPGKPSDTGTDLSLPHMDRTRSTKRGGPPFNNPTNVAVAPNGDLYVSDGYGNARVHRFTATGELIHSWGEPGSGAGEFRIPHDVCIDERGRLLVADRENDRLQLFDLDGSYLETWVSQKPCSIEVHDGHVYVGETRVDGGSFSFRRGIVPELEYARVSIYDHDGKVVDRFGYGEDWPADGCQPGNITSAHGIAVDSRGDVYVAETTYSTGGARGVLPEDCHTFQKFVRS